MHTPLQYALPFSLRDAVSVTRVGKILGVHRKTVYRMVTDFRVLEYMQRSERGIRLIRYSSLVSYCDGLRQTFSLPDRRPALSNVLFRHADRDIPPWPLDHNLTTEDVMQALQLEKTRVVDMAMRQQMQAYQLIPGAPWRFHRPTVEAYLARVNDRARTRPSVHFSGWTV